MAPATMAFTSTFHGISWNHQTACQPGRSTCLAMRAAPITAQNESNGEAGAGKEGERWTTGKIRAPRQIHGATRRSRGRVRTQGKYYNKRELAPAPPGLRVTAGTARGRRLQSPNVHLRPMMGKVREALFSMLEMLEVVRPDGSTLDLFAGSGSIGIESLSRGMGSAVFVDAAEDCVDTISENLRICKMADRGRVQCARVENILDSATRLNNNEHYSLITVTPPYEEVDYGELMTQIATSDCVGEGTFVVVEYPVELKSLPPSIAQRLIGVRNRRYGRTVLALYACQPDSWIDIRPEEFIDASRR